MKNYTIIGRRWFQRSYGNTYHTVEIYVDGKFIGKSPETYGYGDCYRQTAAEMLGMEYSKLCQLHRDNFVFSVTDVSRERDL